MGRAFTNCTKITGVTFPTANTFTSIGTETQLLGKAKGFSFYNAGIKTLTIPDNVTELGEQGFRETKVENVLFFDCKQLKRIVFPDNVQEFGSEVFGSCSALKYVELGNNVTKIKQESMVPWCTLIIRQYFPIVHQVWFMTIR